MPPVNIRRYGVSSEDDTASTWGTVVLWHYPPMRCTCPADGYCAACRAYDQRRSPIQEQRQQTQRARRPTTLRRSRNGPLQTKPRTVLQ